MCEEGEVSSVIIVGLEKLLEIMAGENSTHFCAMKNLFILLVKKKKSVAVIKIVFSVRPKRTTFRKPFSFCENTKSANER